MASICKLQELKIDLGGQISCFHGDCEVWRINGLRSHSTWQSMVEIHLRLVKILSSPKILEFDIIQQSGNKV
jgi:hypothetical protein